jgi:phospholipid/cholesterol/gamma-HCH transport system permease protein
VSKSLTQVPQAATKGVMQSLLLVFLLDAVIMAATLT